MGACQCGSSHAFMGHTRQLLEEAFNVEAPALQVLHSSTSTVENLPTPYNRMLLCNQVIIFSCALK